ncbi:AzlC family ABC transporter permease [Streptomyces sp. SID10115]|uniref:AzlC family ABC transporter permease n=2 Tax=Streptomyces TaxID=1883 RepID=UPI001F156CE4|nr:AzlC family ABC transporter permease [Streptomyces sp. SID10115]
MAFVPLGLAFGALAVQSGLDWWWASLSAAVAFGGSFEFLLIGLVIAVTPLASIAVAAFMVNLRHVFYALSFPLHRVPGRLGKAYATFALCDEAYALTSAEKARSWPGPHILWTQFFLHTYWTGSATAGALLGTLIPQSVTGLDFALPALFTVLALDALRDRDLRHRRGLRSDLWDGLWDRLLRDRLPGGLPTPLLALTSVFVARAVFPDQMLVVAFALFTAGLLVRHLMTTAQRPNHA